MVWFPLGPGTCVSPCQATDCVGSSQRIVRVWEISCNMNVMKMCVCWVIMTMKFVVVNLALGGVLDLILFGPLESWLCGYFGLSEFSDRSGH